MVYTLEATDPDFVSAWRDPDVLSPYELVYRRIAAVHRGT